MEQSRAGHVEQSRTACDRWRRSIDRHGADACVGHGAVRRAPCYGTARRDGSSERARRPFFQTRGAARERVQVSFLLSGWLRLGGHTLGYVSYPEPT